MSWRPVAFLAALLVAVSGLVLVAVPRSSLTAASCVLPPDAVVRADWDANPSGAPIAGWSSYSGDVVNTPESKVYADGLVLTRYFRTGSPLWSRARLTPAGLDKLRACSDDARFAQLPERLAEDPRVPKCEVLNLGVGAGTYTVTMPTEAGTHSVEVGPRDERCGPIPSQFTAPRDLMRDLMARTWVGDYWTPPAATIRFRAESPKEAALPLPASAGEVEVPGSIRVVGPDVETWMALARERYGSEIEMVLPDGRRVRAVVRFAAPGE